MSDNSNAQFKMGLQPLDRLFKEALEKANIFDGLTEAFSALNSDFERVSFLLKKLDESHAG